MQLRLILTREADYVNIWLAANISDGTNPSQISFVQELAKLLKSVYEKNMFV
jgi:hypothetical protein